MSELNEQEKTRRESLIKLKELGINPFPAEEFKTTTTSVEIKENYSETKNNLQNVCLAGRIMSRRIMGKASFAEIKDFKGRIQLYLNRDEICSGEDKTMYNDVFKKHLDIGDIIGVEGRVFKTKVGETSVFVKKITLLSKSIKPLPIVKTDSEGVTHDAFKDTELRYRQRSLDLIVNDGSWLVFETRTKYLIQ